jgi:preprotein translocase subunit YajC
MASEQMVNPLTQFTPFLVIFAIFYFLVIKPEQTKQNERKQRLTNVKKNDEVVTNGGIHGTVVNVKQTTIIVRIDDNVKIEIDKEAIASIKSV